MLSIIITIIVGIACSGMKAETKTYYEKCIHDAGAELVIFDEYATTDSIAEAQMATVDALIVPGKTKKDTKDRSASDRRLIGAAQATGKPALGICLGHQHINAYFGGHTRKNTELAPGSKVVHKLVDEKKYNVGLNTKNIHKIIIDPTSDLYKILGKKKIGVNASHLWAVNPDELGEGLRITATAPDGIVEAIEGNNCLGVQFHPEYLYGKLGAKKFLGIFKYLVEKAATPAAPAVPAEPVVPAAPVEPATL